jgi:uncharacterized damage-inducible protein DinB
VAACSGCALDRRGLPPCSRRELRPPSLDRSPAGYNAKDFDKSTTDKTKIIEILKDSFDHVRHAVILMPDADLDKQLDWFGGKNTEQGILLFMMRHMAEHLGQSIAYARMIGIVPPWTEDAQKAKKPETKPKQ